MHEGRVQDASEAAFHFIMHIAICSCPKDRSLDHSQRRLCSSLLFDLNVDMSITYRQYAGEEDMQAIMTLVQFELSEPYVVYTYRYFLDSWPQLSILAVSPESTDPIGVIICKQSVHRENRNRGYIAMLSVDKRYRRRGIASSLVQRAIEVMVRDGADEVVLETEFDNLAAIALYEYLGFIREKRLHRFYLNGKDAFRLVLSVSPTQRQPSDLGAAPAAGSTSMMLPGERMYM
ncbi:hypothetical protein QCA50_014595 [Cerrena zonata]|uniref:N-acetyltransferase domain-containing protein n=1 Tax=Cerrena zonata TaxID=2478898 RepID=A0AAW0G065_9APHY